MSARLVLLFALLAGSLALPGAEIRLAGPLATRIAIDHPGTTVRLRATVTVPDDAPSDLGCAVWVADRHGRWWQRQLIDHLTPGSHTLAADLDGLAPLTPQGHGAGWNPGAMAEARRVGLTFWTTHPGGRLRVDSLRVEALKPARAGDARLIITALDPPTVATRSRWQIRAVPEPWPEDPWDPEAFSLRLSARGPGAHAISTTGFHDQPMRAWDRGDREEVQPWGRAAFAARTRATAPGAWELRLSAAWRGGASATTTLPPLTARGAPGDDISRVDAADPRFFSADGTMVWPIGPNIHTVWDVRGVERTGSRLTPDRGTLSWRAWFDRLHTAGATGCEIWLSSWNLALEWRGDWCPWRGVGRISEERAWQLDRILDLAEERGIRINLVVNNHGQVSQRIDAEWDNNPANRANGGWLDDPAMWFEDRRALATQERSRHHLIARYADSPAILGWKLWSEVNLTELGHLASEEQNPRQAWARELLRTWHKEACARWAALDPWHHPTTTHWAGNYRRADRGIAALPGLGYVCINAYHNPDSPPVWTWLARSTTDPARQDNDGLAYLGKPILVTEYGGSWRAAPEPQLEVALAVGGWVGLVSGHAGTPMLWWHEWLDQGGRFGQYQAIARFLADEDLRGANRRCVLIDAGPGCWARMWAGPGRMLGYILDEAWGRSGGAGSVRPSGEVILGEGIAAGPIQVAWWDADLGVELARALIEHPGGRLAVTVPAFRRHVAFKAWR
jgi:hypothetical protein